MNLPYTEQIKNHSLLESVKVQKIQENKMGEWKDIVSGDVISFDKVGASIEGTLVARRKGGKWDSNIYDIKVGDELKTVFGSVILDDRMETVKIDDKIKIEYLGTVETKGGKDAHNFKVQVWKD